MYISPSNIEVVLFLHFDLHFGHLLNQKSIMQFMDVLVLHRMFSCWGKKKSGITCPPPACEPPSSAPCLHRFPCLDEEPSGRHQQHSLRSRQALSCREIKLPQIFPTKRQQFNSQVNS